MTYDKSHKEQQNKIDRLHAVHGRRILLQINNPNSQSEKQTQHEPSQNLTGIAPGRQSAPPQQHHQLERPPCPPSGLCLERFRRGTNTGHTSGVFELTANFVEDSGHEILIADEFGLLGALDVRERRGA